MKKLFFLFFFFIYSISIAQSSFIKLFRPEKVWVLCHPVKAKRAHVITKNVLHVVDSIKKSGIIDNDISGGNLDAFKHTYWMASLAYNIGKKQALKLGCAHEKGNYLQFKKHQLEDAQLPDSISSVMDLRNNQTGVSMVEKSEVISQLTIQLRVLDALRNGKLMIIKKDEQGNYLTCEGEVIILKNWYGKWNVPKCLIPSFSH